MRRRFLKRKRRRIQHDSSIVLAASAAVGVLAGLAVGAFLVQRNGGLKSVINRLADTVRRDDDEAEDEDSGPPSSVYEMDGLADDGQLFDDEEPEEDDIEPNADDEAAARELEERVLAAFLNDPILSRLPIRISAESDGIVELRGRVADRELRKHASTLARGVPGVTGIANGIAVSRRRRAPTS